MIPIFLVVSLIVKMGFNNILGTYQKLGINIYFY